MIEAAFYLPWLWDKWALKFELQPVVRCGTVEASGEFPSHYVPKPFWRYWICAICINQHASICGSSMGVRDTVTGEVLPSCDCLTPKYFNDHPIQCELNKFDCMMKLLHRRHSATGGGTAFLQVVAIDRDFSLFSRAWCVAELVEAYNSKMDQHVMLHSPEVRLDFFYWLNKKFLTSNGAMPEPLI